MRFINKLFRSTTVIERGLPSGIDMHCHLIPGLDDGSKSIFESCDMIVELKRLGYHKAICTPHIMTDVSNNTPEKIQNGLKELREGLAKNKIEFEVQAAAEYYVDEFFLKHISEQPLMTFGKNYVLIETGTMMECKIIKDVIFELRVSGYEPVLAHPERYSYFWGKRVKENYRNYKDMELWFQINLISLAGFYSPQVKKTAEMLIKEKMVDFIGTDAHNLTFITAVEKSLNNRYVNLLYKLNLLNNTL